MNFDKVIINSLCDLFISYEILKEKQRGWFYATKTHITYMAERILGWKIKFRIV